MLHLYHSNRVEGLLGQLVRLLLEQSDSPLVPQTIVVENPGLAHWLKMQLANTLGIAANLEFPMPARFFWQVQKHLMPEDMTHWAQESVFNKDTLTWLILDCIEHDNLTQQPDFFLLDAYLNDVNGQSRAARAFQLAQNIADLYDQYLVYRPDWIEAWEAGKQEIDGEPLNDDKWQAILWLKLIQKAKNAGLPLHHRASLTKDFLHLLKQPQAKHSLPSSVVFFGFSTLPKAQIETLALMAEHTQVHLLTPNPSEVYWGDIMDETLQAKLRLRNRSIPLVDSGNAFLAALGRMGQDFQRMLVDVETIQDHDLFYPAEDASLLAVVQNQILSLSDSKDDPVEVEKSDNSVQLVGCHSPMREVEVLHDYLLHCIQDLNIEPQNIVVMIPDVAAYAPYIDAVFQTGVRNSGNQRVSIPYSISDRPVQEEHPLINGFAQLLNIQNSRFSYSDVIALLEIPAVHKRFDITEDELPALKQWLQEAGIRWGFDGNHRTQHDLPNWQKNTWLYGFRRLLMGYAYSSQFSVDAVSSPYGIAPVDSVEGLEASNLGSLIKFVEALHEYLENSKDMRTATEWRQFLQQTLTHFFITENEEEWILEHIHSVLDNWVDATQKVNYHHAIAFEVVADGIHQRLQQRSGSQHFMVGKVNFCTLLPMRSIPFDIVAVLGLNDQEYPRNVTPNSLDLMRFNRRIGDRSRRDEDRYLFLEAILSARKQLWLSYKSRDQKQNHALTPSVVLAEFMDYLESGFKASEDGVQSVLDQLYKQHPLQPFNAQYFSNQSNIFSYQKDWFDALEEYSEQEIKTQNFIVPETLKTNNERDIDLDHLCQYFSLPAKSFLNNVLNIQFYNVDDDYPDDEPFKLNGLEAYHIKRQLLDSALRQKELEMETINAELPYGELGEKSWNNIKQSLAPLLNKISELDLQQTESPIEINVSCDLGGEIFSVIGWHWKIYNGQFIDLIPSQLKTKYIIPFLVRHSALCAMGYEVPAQLLTTSGHLLLKPMTQVQANDYLTSLMAFYKQHQYQAVPFYPESTWAYMSEYENPTKGFKKASPLFLGNSFSSVEPERENAYLVRCFGLLDSLPEESIKLGERLFLPYLEHDLLEVVK